MRLRAQCKSCAKHNKVSSKGVLLRRDLEEKVGEIYNFSCAECGTENTMHVNGVFALTNEVFKYSLAGFGLLLVLIGLFPMGAAIIVAAFVSSSSANSNLFNKSKI